VRPSQQIAASRGDLAEAGSAEDGYLYPEGQRVPETRVICRIHPRRITIDAIHGSKQ
jgi:hypothetical protein